MRLVEWDEWRRAYSKQFYICENLLDQRDTKKNFPQISLIKTDLAIWGM